MERAVTPAGPISVTTESTADHRSHLAVRATLGATQLPRLAIGPISVIQLDDLTSLDLGSLLTMLDHGGRLIDPAPDVRLAAAQRILVSSPADLCCWLGLVMSKSRLAGSDVDHVNALVMRAAEVFVQVLKCQGEVVDVAPTSVCGADVARLLRLAADLGVPVRFATIDGARGRCSAEGIVVDPSDADLAFVVGHELGHALDLRLGLLGYNASRRAREQLADDLGALLRASAVSTTAEAESLAIEFIAANAPPDDGGIPVDVRLLRWWEVEADLTGWSP